MNKHLISVINVNIQKVLKKDACLAQLVRASASYADCH